mmetsp:Transcript_40504/g.95132  ORF Transcript_40504/g.95132 Transcript_40504/m.95132 type:complete len:253 (-) Transcript_40504:62-820(-)
MKFDTIAKGAKKRGHGRRGVGKRLREADRIEIIAELEKSKPPSKRKIARKYGVGESAIRRLWNNREVVKARSKDMNEDTKISMLRSSTPKHPHLEDILYEWIENMRKVQITLPPKVVMSKAQRIAMDLNIPPEQFCCSWQWFARFKKRRGITKTMLHREEGEVPPDAVEEEDSETVVDRTEFGGIDHLQSLMMDVEEQLGSEGFVNLAGDDFSTIYENFKNISSRVSRIGKRSTQMTLHDMSSNIVTNKESS